MSLTTDRLFFEILSSDTAFMAAISNRLFNTTIPVPDEQFYNEPVPYVIISFDGLNGGDTTKDDPYESDFDHVQIGIEVAADDRETLGVLMKQIRRVIHTHLAWILRYAELRANGEPLTDANGFHLWVVRNYEAIASDIPLDYTFSADGVRWDQFKPCYFQTLHYQCDVPNNLDDDEQEE